MVLGFTKDSSVYEIVNSAIDPPRPEYITLKAARESSNKLVSVRCEILDKEPLMGEGDTLNAKFQVRPLKKPLASSISSYT